MQCMTCRKPIEYGLEMSHPQTLKPLWAWLALGAVTFHAIVMVLLHLLVPEVDPMADMVGAYLASQYQFLSRLTFLALGCALASLGLALRAYLSVGVSPRIAAVLLVVAIVGFGISSGRRLIGISAL